MDDYKELIECGIGPVADMAMKCEAVFSNHERALVSISGGADSDVMIDVVERVRKEQPIEVIYVWFDTGMEYRATKEHLAYLERRYGIEIERHRAIKTIPVSCREYGQPFRSKYVSAMMARLQRIDFEWDGGTFEVLSEKYGHRQRSAMRWWCNDFAIDGKIGRFDIGRIRHLKEFIMENPPWFKISSKCCDYAKKNVSHKIEKERSVDVSLIGVRKAEGGSRAAYNKCFDHAHGIDTYRPLFWLSNGDKERYDEAFGIVHSDCYEVWGFKRTGCAGCPYAKDRWKELATVETHEPNIAKACKKVFADAYEYTRMFEEFKRNLKGGESQMRISF